MAGKRRRPAASTPPPRHPRFCKVLVGEDFAHRLRIPPNFMKHISKEASKIAILEGPNGRSWRVELTKNVKGSFLSSGWTNFVSDHSLREHDFLVFRHDGDMHFNVLIFDKSACEKNYVITSKTRKRLLLGEGRDEYNGQVEQNTSRNEWPMLPSNDKHVPNQLQDHSTITVQGRGVPSSNPNGHAKVEIEDDVKQICMLDPDTKCAKKYSRRKMLRIKQGRVKAQEAANSFSSLFPYFISRMTPNKVSKGYLLNFPVHFAREHLPQTRTELILRDPSGKAWLVGYAPGPGSRLFGGWSKFVHGNNLRDGDFCAFELVGKLELRVSIFRVVETTSSNQV